MGLAPPLVEPCRPGFGHKLCALVRKPRERNQTGQTTARCVGSEASRRFASKLLKKKSLYFGEGLFGGRLVIRLCLIGPGPSSAETCHGRFLRPR